MTFLLSDFLKSGAVMSLSHDKLLLGWGEVFHLSAEQVDQTQPAFYFSDFFLTLPQPWIQYSHWMEISKQEFTHLLIPSIQMDLCDWTIQQPEKFREAFEELIALLQSGRLEKGVPYLFIHSSHSMDEKRLQFCLQNSIASLEKRKGYLYGHWHLSSGVLGITPELLFSHEQSQLNTVHTMALAGTCHPSECDQEFLKNSKERHEHQLVVQGIEQSLQSLGTVKMGPIQLLKLPMLTHLMTLIDVDLYHPFNFDALVSSLHPTPALGAYPLTAGRTWLSEFQQHTPRKYYGAPIGFQNFQTGSCSCFVGIRNVQWDRSGMCIGAGCGVVKQSQFDKEWEEIQLKIQSIRSQFCL